MAIPKKIGGKPIGALTSIPTPPKDLDEDGATAWREAGAYLLSNSMLHSGDLHSLEAYSHTYSRMLRIQRELADQPMFIEGKANPAINSANTTAATLGKLAAGLCLNPQARGRLPAGKQLGPPAADRQTARRKKGWEEVLGRPAGGPVKTVSGSR